MKVAAVILISLLSGCSSPVEGKTPPPDAKATCEPNTCTCNGPVIQVCDHAGVEHAPWRCPFVCDVQGCGCVGICVPGEIFVDCVVHTCGPNGDWDPPDTACGDGGT
jgi:hypothetical protein